MMLATGVAEPTPEQWIRIAVAVAVIILFVAAIFGWQYLAGKRRRAAYWDAQERLIARRNQRARKGGE